MKILNRNIFLLYFFHLSLSIFFNYLSYSSFLKDLHNSNGTWNFMRDSLLYHNEALILLNYLETSNFYKYFISFNEHINTKIISLLYYLTTLSLPIIYVPFHSLLWVTSVVLIFYSTKNLFNTKSAYISVIPLFFISYLTLYMGLLRESLNVLGYSLYIFSVINIYKEKKVEKNLILFFLSFILLLSVRAYLIPITMVFTFLILITFIFLKIVKLRYFFAISTIIFFSVFLNTKSFLSLGLADEHIEIRNKFFGLFYTMDQNIETQTKKINLEDMQFLTFDWINSEINKNIINPNIVYDEISYEILREETKNLSLKPAMEKIIEIATLYRFEKKLTQREKLNLINSLDKIIGRLIRFSDDIKIYMIKSLLKVRNINNNKVLAEGLKKNNINQIDSISEDGLIDVKDGKNINSIQSNNTEIETIENCIFGPISNFALKLNNIRSDFEDVIVRGGSKASSVQLTNLCDFFILLPKIASDGLLSPYPKMWFQSGTETGRIGRIISGMETIITYIFLLSFAFTLINKNKNIIYITPLILLSLSIIIITAYAVPNYGALYRMRMGPMLIFYILGSYSLYLFIEYFKNKKNE